MSSPSSPAVRSPALRGRDAELAALLRLLDAARDGSGGAVILRGARGTGRSAMLRAAADRADGFVLLGTRGTESESRLPYAGLHGLLRPVADRLDALPPAQAAVLAEALELGTSDGGLALPAAVLNLLAAAGRPVLACVDDVHHLDARSRDVLFFVARRLSGEPVALLFGADDAPSGTGDGADAPDDIPVLDLGALPEGAARQLADDLAPELAEDVRASLLDIAHGNPLAIVELIGSLTPEQMSGAAAPPETPPRDGRLWRAHAARLAGLPGGTADALLLLAADPDLDTAALLRVTGRGCALTALEPAERAGVIVRTAGDRYGFREPAMRSVVYAGASPARRRAAHRLLANLPDHDRLRRAWHRAAALDGPGEELADELAA
ncbi:ATP-binding protein, partial [Streptosporangium fragile]|uniref:ATP-binding protein n=1 Tax=Streptosporangium fragile TaxID=46186 RepID=UPI0031EC9E62